MSVYDLDELTPEDAERAQAWFDIWEARRGQLPWIRFWGDGTIQIDGDLHPEEMEELLALMRSFKLTKKKRSLALKAPPEDAAMKHAWHVVLGNGFVLCRRCDAVLCNENRDEPCPKREE